MTRVDTEKRFAVIQRKAANSPSFGSARNCCSQLKKKDKNMELLDKVKERLSRVIHSETGMDVIRMNMVRDLKVHEDGKVELRFRPYSIHCSIGFRQGIKIKKAVKSVPGVNGVHVKVDGHICAERLEKLLGVVN